jgi:hypothetical protein
MTQEKDTRNYKAAFIACFLLLLALIGGVYFSLKKWVNQKTTTATNITASTATSSANDELKARVTALEKSTPDKQLCLDLTARVEAIEACFETVN